MVLYGVHIFLRRDTTQSVDEIVGKITAKLKPGTPEKSAILQPSNTPARPEPVARPKSNAPVCDTDLKDVYTPLALEVSNERLRSLTTRLVAKLKREYARYNGEFEKADSSAIAAMNAATSSEGRQQIELARRGSHQESGNKFKHEYEACFQQPVQALDSQLRKSLGSVTMTKDTFKGVIRKDDDHRKFNVGMSALPEPPIEITVGLAAGPTSLTSLIDYLDKMAMLL